MGRSSTFIVTIFALDGFLVLFPPLYWAASGASTSALGIPLSVLYFLGVGIFVSSSVVVVYLVDRKAGLLT
jgi:hypothetical protein